jgi:hypothetical protein
VNQFYRREPRTNIWPPTHTHTLSLTHTHGRSTALEEGVLQLEEGVLQLEERV